MSVLNRIAYFQSRRDEVPNQDLARSLARTKNRAGIREIAENLHSSNRNIQSDCLKVLYEIGYLDPALIAGYADDFLDLLHSKNNRMVWGSMIALATISPLQARAIGKRLDEVMKAIDAGSLITVVWGVKTLAGVASASRTYRARILPVLLRQLKTCLPRDVPMHAQSILPAVDESNRGKFLAVLSSRLPDLSPSQTTRLRKLLRQIESEAGSPGRRRAPRAA
jgi:hypothetical protein